MRPAVAVIAKAPVPGRVKTRLSPPFSPAAAAALAEASLRDTLAAVREVPGVRRVLVLDGAWAAPGFDVIPQRGAGLGERLAAAFADLGGPALVVGMDTPQLTPAHLRSALTALARRDAVIGPALDGGYWAIGLAAPHPRAFAGVPMSRPDTCERQRAQLRRLGLSWTEAQPLRDVDDAADARAVARELPAGSAFARALSAAG